MAVDYSDVAVRVDLRVQPQGNRLFKDWSESSSQNVGGRACSAMRVITRRCCYTLTPCLVLLCLTLYNVSGQQIDQLQIQSDDQLFFALLTAANNPSTIEALLVNKKGLLRAELWKRLIDTAEYSPKPLTIYAIALQVARKLDDRRLAAITLYKTGWYQFGQGNISSAIDNYRQSSLAFEDAGSRRDLIYIFADLGTLSIYSSDYKKAKEYSEQSLKIAQEFKNASGAASEWPDEYGLGTALSNFGNISKREGEYEQAIDYFHQSLTLYRQIDSGDGKHSSQIIDNLADIGRTYSAKGDHVRALAYLNQAMDLAKTKRNINRMASVANSIGILYTNQRDYAKAIEFFEQGLELANSVNDRFKQASMLLNIGVAYQFQGNYEQARQKFVSSLEIAKAINDKEIIIHIGEGMGAIYKEQGKYSEALAVLENSLSLAKSIEDTKRIAELLWRQAEVFYAQGEFVRAISSAKEAVTLAEQLSMRNVSYLASTTLGRAYRGNKQDALAIETFVQAINGIESMRHEVAGLEQERQLFFEDKVDPYHEMVDLLLNQQDREQAFDALFYAEKAKGRVLLDVLGNSRIDLSSSMSEAEKAQERKLNKDIVDLNRQITVEDSKQDSEAKVLSDLNRRLRAARLAYETFQNSLSVTHPQLVQSDRRTPELTRKDVNDLVVDPKTAFLEYVVSESTTYLFVLTKKETNDTDVKVYPIDIDRKRLGERVREFREMLAGQDPGFADTARQLYDLLLKPAKQQLKDQNTLCIVPDGVLWDLPFQAVQSRDSRYVLEDHAVYYSPSLSVLKGLSSPRKNSGPVSASLLAFGNPRMSNEIATNLKAVYRGEVLAPLPEAEAEVNALKEIWKPAPTTVFVGTNAGKSNFKAEASKYRIIHLATHGILDDSNPIYSRLVMSRTENDPNDDGLLEAREIMQLRLNADLVVLSACQTARGRIGAGEGMIGMSWAFMVAGVPTMVASQWKVDSTSTAGFMINFHRQLRNQIPTDETSKANALRQAALELMKEPRYRHPFFWAAFVMIGNGNGR